MKKIGFLLICLFFFYSCQKTEDKTFEEVSSLKIKVLHENTPQSTATIMCLSDYGKEVVLKCDKNGEVFINDVDNIKMLVAMAPNMSAIVENPKNGYLEIFLENLDETNVKEKSAQYVGAFGVYDTDGNGDVRFKYQGDFLYYDCINYLPWLLTSPDPNDWDGWDLTDFPSPWKGKKLLVPTRYQTYHSTVYGYSISGALLLYAEI